MNHEGGILLFRLNKLNLFNLKSKTKAILQIAMRFLLPISLFSLNLLISCSPSQIDSNFHPGINLSYQNTIVSTSSSTVVSGKSITLKVSLRDQYFSSFSSSDLKVQFYLSGGTSTGVLGSVTTNGSGVYTVSYRGLLAGTPNQVHVLVNGIEVSSSLPTVQVLQVDFSLVNSVIEVSASSVTSSAAVQLTLKVYDTKNTAVDTGGLSVQFLNSGGTSQGTFGATTDHFDGTYTTTFTGTTSGTPTQILVNIEGLQVTSSTPSITVNPGLATHFVLTGVPASQTAGSAFALHVYAKDSNENTDISYSSTLSFSSSDGQAVLPAPLVISSGTGVFSINLKTAGTKTITVSDGNFSLTSAGVTVNPAGYDVTQSSVTVSASTVVSTQALTATLTTKDSYGNLNPSGLPANGLIVFTSSLVGGTGSFSNFINAGSGIYTSTFTAATTGAVTLGATLSGVAVTTSASATIQPVFQFSSMTINGATSGGSTSNSYVQISLDASDAIAAANITHFCLKYNITSTPLASDSCWISVTASPPGLTAANSIHLNNFNFLIGLTTGDYSVSAWLKDSLGNISILSGGGSGVIGKDLVSITFNQLTPPTIIDVVGATSASPQYPLPSASDLTLPMGSDVYVQWNISSSTNGLGATPISLYYTTNNLTYTLISNSITNGANGCSPDANHSGCYLWSGGAPTNSFFAIKAVVTDSVGLNASAIGPGANVGSNILYLAGNTDPGTNGSANSSSFINYGAPDPQSFVITTNGTIYFRDVYRGILKVDPATGVQSQLILNTNTTYVDGALGTATVNKPVALTLDSQDRLYIYDIGGIRRYDPTLNTVTTIIGGPAAVGTGATTAALSTKINFSAAWGNGHFPFFVDSLGNIIFQSESASVPSLRIRIYSPTTGNVTSVYPNGNDTSCGTAASLSSYAISNWFSGFTMGGTIDTLGLGLCINGNCGCKAAYNVTTGTVIPSVYPAVGYVPSIGHVVGLDGNAYFFTTSGSITKYNKTTYALTTIVGNGTSGSVPDGSSSNSAIFPSDAFVTASGKVYFFERGKIRFVDQNSKIQTIAGVSRSFGDGGSALSARIGDITDFKLWNDGTNDKIIFSDTSELRFRQFTLGGTISTLIGNGSTGSPNTTAIANAQPINYSNFGTNNWLAFQVNPSTGTVYAGAKGSTISQVLQSTGKWSDLVGGGGTAYSSADGKNGNQVVFTGYWPAVLGFDGTNLLAGVFRYLNGGYDSYLKTYSLTSPYVQSSFAGVSGTAGNLCAVGTTLTTCMIPASGYDSSSFNDFIWDSYGNQWVGMLVSGNKVYSFFTGGSLGLIATLPNSARGFDFVHDASQQKVFYCSTSDSKIHKYNVNTSSDTTYSWPVPNMLCRSHGVIYSSSRNSVIFAYNLNGLFGIAEIPNP